MSGDYRPGQPFPSVRALAADLKINPNTAAKVIQHLIQERWLEVRPGVGTFVAEPPEARAADKAKLLQQTVEGLSVAAVSYYVVGLIGYLAKGSASLLGHAVEPEVAMAAAVPIVVLLVWWSVRHIRMSHAEHDRAAGE